MNGYKLMKPNNFGKLKQLFFLLLIRDQLQVKFPYFLKHSVSNKFEDSLKMFSLEISVHYFSGKSSSS